MKLKEVYEVTQHAVAQSLGSDYMTDNDGNLKAMDTFKIADIGRDISNIQGQNMYDVALGAMVDRLATTYLESREKDIIVPPMYIKPEEWGAFIQRATCDILDIIDDGMYRLVDKADYSQIENTYYKPPVHTKLYQEGLDLIVPISITQKQLKTAFLSWDEMQYFLGWLQSQINQTIDHILECYSYMLLQCAIAVSDNNTQTAVHLITEYNAKYGTSIATAEDALYGANAKEFKRFMCERIEFVRRSMRKYSKVYNNKFVPTHTPKSDNILVMLDEVDIAITMGLDADTFHNQLLDFGEYFTVPCWQGMNAKNDETQLPSYALETSSKVMINADPDNTLGIGTSAYTGSYCIGLCYDRYAMGQTIKREDVSTHYVASKQFTNTFHNLLLNYILDTNYNMVAFFLD